MEAALRQWLAAQPDVAALLGTTLPTFRFFPLVAPQNTVGDYVTYETTSVARDDAYTQDGESGFCTRTMELTVVAKVYDDGVAIWNAIRKAVVKFHREKANKATGAMVGVPVQYIRIAAETDDYVPPQEAGKQGLHLRNGTLEISHLEETD